MKWKKKTPGDGGMVKLSKILRLAVFLYENKTTKSLQLGRVYAQIFINVGSPNLGLKFFHNFFISKIMTIER